MKTLRLDIISDVSCPWCIVGYKGLEKALANLSEEIDAVIEWHPFELNPMMPPEGQEINEHLTQKYGITVEQSEKNREVIHERGLSVGYTFGRRGGGRIYNTFDAHRLLHWSKQFGKQTELKLALFDLYFQQEGNPSDHSQLIETAASVGLDKAGAKEVLDSDQFASEVRQEQQRNQEMGIQSVPAVIVDSKYLISGGQPPEAFEQAFKDIASRQL